MASINQVAIELQVRGEREATQALKRYSSASDKLTRSVLDAAAKVENTSNAWDRANKLFEKGVLNTKGLQAAQTQLARELAVVNGYVKSNGALNTQKALAELKAVEATKQAAAAEARANAERQRAQQSYRQLKAAIDPAYAAQMRLKKAHDTVRQALRQGIITREQAAESLRQYRTQAQMGSVGVRGFGDANHIASRKTNAYGMAMQQTGYQVGDFIVQVQSGTNAFVAFGQQATQLVGILPELAGRFGLNVNKLIGISAVLGIVIPLATALGAAFMRTRGEANDFADSTFDINEAAKNATEELRSYREELAKLTSQYETLGEIGLDQQINKLQSELENMEGRRAQIMQSALVGFGAAGGIGAGQDVAEMTQSALQANTREIEEQIRLKKQQLYQLVMERDSVERVRELTSDTNELLEAGRQAQLERNRAGRKTIIEMENQITLAETIRDYGRDSVEAVRLRAEQEAISRNLSTENAEKYVEMALQLHDIESSIHGVAGATEYTNQALQRQVTHQMQIATMQREVNAGVQEILKNRDAELQKQQDRIRLAQTELEFGRNSKEFRQAQLEIDERIFRQRLAENGILGNNADLIVDAWREAQNLEQAVEGARNATEETADAAGKIGPALQGAINQANAFANAIDRAADRVAGIGISTAGLAAERRALEAGRTEAEAAALGAATSERERILSTVDRPGPQRDEMAQREFERVYQATLAQEQERQRLSAVRESLRPDTGSGAGASTQSAVDEAEKVRAAVDKLIASYDEQYATSLKVSEAQETINKALEMGVISGSEATSIMEQYEASLRDVEDPMMKIAQTARDELGDALMSIVDGTASAEDAFKNMARAILKQAFDLLVIKPLMDSLFGSSGGSGGGIIGGLPSSEQANGGAWNKGVQMFADGGVVSAPTAFRHSAGLGVMGEAGPEAIMPLKRGKGGKLGVVAEGGQGDVVVENHFHIAANGDDSVKRIIQQEAPKIANYTSQQIMEQRRRGGAVKQTFG